MEIISILTAFLFVFGGIIGIPNDHDDVDITNFEYQDPDPELIPEFDITEMTKGSFIENKGQWSEDILFIAETSFGQIGLGKGCVYFDMREYIQIESDIDLENGFLNYPMEGSDQEYKMKGHVVKYSFEESQEVIPIGIDPIPKVSNYFYGNDPGKWARGVRTFQSVVYKDLYEEIDLKYYFTEKGAKYDFILNPGAEPEDIKISIEGHESFSINKDEMKIQIPGERSLSDKDLITFYDDDHNEIIGSKFMKVDENSYSFQLEDHDQARTVIIDPLFFSTYLGGSIAETVRSTGFDPNGDLCLVGHTNSTDFPTTVGPYDETFNGGQQDLFITKLKNDGSDLIFSTYIGGDGIEQIYGSVNIDQNGHIYISGYTNSTDFPTTTGAFDETHNGELDFYILKLKNDGSDLIFSTYIGGSDDDWFGSFVIDPDGDIYISSSTYSTDFPTTNGAYDRTYKGNQMAYLLKLKSDGSDLIFSTFFGGNGYDWGRSVIVDASEDVFVYGRTSSTDFPTTSGAFDRTHNGDLYDLYVMKFKNDGSDIIFSTYIGGNGDDYEGDGIFQLDPDGNIIVFGRTESTDFPTTSGAFDESYNGGSYDLVVIKLKSDGSDLIFSTYIGGNDNDSSFPFVDIDLTGNIYIGGSTQSTDFPSTPGAFDETHNGGNDIWILKMKNDGSDLIFSTFIGGSENEYGIFDFDLTGNIFICGSTGSTDFPITQGAYDEIHSGGSDIFVTQLTNDGSSVIYSSFINEDGGAGGISSCIIDTQGSSFICGHTSSSDFQTTPGVYDEIYNGDRDIFVMKFLVDSQNEPNVVYSVDIYSDPAYSIEIEVADIDDNVFIELRGEDGNNSNQDWAGLNISFGRSIPDLLRIYLRETNETSGIYRSLFKIPYRTLYLDGLEFSSYKDPTKFDTLFIDKPFRPTVIDSLKVCLDEECTNEIENIEIGETIYLEIRGQDANPITSNFAFVNLSSDKTSPIPTILLLNETGINTGIYRGEFVIPNTMVYVENITISSVRDPTKTKMIKVRPFVLIRSIDEKFEIDEDEEYSVHFMNVGWVTDHTWDLQTDKDWISFNAETQILSGTPNNSHVGHTSIELNLSDDFGHFDLLEYTIQVHNVVPILMGTDIIEIDQGEYYETDYNCDDEGQGDTTYYLTTSADWLEIDPGTGVLFGLPENDDVGVITVTVSVNDGNDGWDSRTFDLSIKNINDAPVIISEDITIVNQNDPFVRNYVAEDIDIGDDLRWELTTDAEFLSIDEEMGTLSGTPTYLDVGSFFVNVSVWDLSNDFDFHNFTLKVLDINDPPIWDDFPKNVDVIHGRTYLFDVNATDYDGELLTYYISSVPESDIIIDDNTGEINWTADIHLFDQAPYNLEVKVSVWDGHVYLNRTFTITVTATEPPIVELVGPADGTKGASTGAILSWEGTDPEDEPITYDIYLHQTEAYVQGYREEALFEYDFDGDNITLSSLDPGKTYFWTIIPNDGCSDGICTSGVMSFRVNYKPTFKEMEDHEVPAGTDFKYKISATDEDSDDLPNLKYSLSEAPEGMTISEETGMIRWTPEDDQIHLHTVTVQVTDGIEINTETFEIEVIEGESSSSSLFIIIIIAVVIVILFAIGIFFFMKKKKQMDEEALKKGEEERAELEHEKEEHVATYEELYGVSAPVMEEEDDEEISTEDLRDSIHTQIEQLEQIDTSEE